MFMGKFIRICQCLCDTPLCLELLCACPVKTAYAVCSSAGRNGTFFICSIKFCSSVAFCCAVRSSNLCILSSGSVCTNIRYVIFHLRLNICCYYLSSCIVFIAFLFLQSYTLLTGRCSVRVLTKEVYLCIQMNIYLTKLQKSRLQRQLTQLWMVSAQLTSCRKSTINQLN